MKLTDKEISIVHEFAQQEFNNRPKYRAEHRFLTECVINSVMRLLSMKKMVIVSSEEYNTVKQLQEEVN